MLNSRLGEFAGSNHITPLDQSHTSENIGWIITTVIGIFFNLTHLHIFLTALGISYMYLILVLIGPLLLAFSLVLLIYTFFLPLFTSATCICFKV